MTDWKSKLAAYLHDPPHKPFRIAGHEDARGPLLRCLGLSEEAIERWEQERCQANPDWQAVAADRFPFPRGGVLHVDWKRDGHLEFRHPLAGTRFLPPSQPRDRSATGETWVEDALRGVEIGDGGWREKFFRVWRLWPERCAREENPLLAYLVADTRIPDHTLWHHNGLGSALEAAGPKPAFLLFQIGPVQDFIAQARKMQDLWSGSYLLSFLISKHLPRCPCDSVQIAWCIRTCEACPCSTGGGRWKPVFFPTDTPKKVKVGCTPMNGSCRVYPTGSSRSSPRARQPGMSRPRPRRPSADSGAR
ncbi:MAG: hypothetical protein HS113_20790 [Verrucomicrobiales bacterium]|nr:hypothetical protein [Verrucomicrobiales bacterium]